MGLVYPHSNNGLSPRVAESNLSTLLEFEHPGIENVTTTLALEAFEEYNNATLGIFHRVKKFSASLAAYTATIGVPVGAVVAATYWLVKDYIRDPSKVVPVFLNNEPMVPDNFATTAIAPYTTPVSALTTLVTVAAFDTLCNQKLGVAPIRSVSKWVVGIISTALLYAAYKAGEITTESYKQQEEDLAKTRELAHELIKEQLKATYDDMAMHFRSRISDSQDSPKAMLELRNIAEELESRTPLLRRLLANLGLNPSEIGLILSNLIDAAKQVKNNALTLRDPKSAVDNQYNTELLGLLSPEEFAGKAISNKAKSDIATAKAHTLGVRHTIGSYISTGVSAIVTTAAAGLAIPAALVAGTYLTNPQKLEGCFASPNLDSCSIVAGFTGFAALPALAIGAVAAKRLHNKFRKITAACAVRKQTSEDKAFASLSRIYDGVAHYLQTSKAARQNAHIILAKLPSIKTQLAATGLPNADQITAKLEQTSESFDL